MDFAFTFYLSKKVTKKTPAFTGATIKLFTSKNFTNPPHS